MAKKTNIENNEKNSEPLQNSSDSAQNSPNTSTAFIPIDELDFSQKLESETGEARTPIKNYAHAKVILEALLFSAVEPLSIKKISSIMNDLPAKTIRALILDLQLDLDQQGRGFQVVEIAGGYQMATRQFVSEWVFALHKHKKRMPLSPATLETVAIIAYKQPITRAEVESIRGVDSGGIIRNLLDQNMIKIVGRKDVIGRPPQYGTTETFLKAFGLKRLSDLPSISELKEMFKSQPQTSAVQAQDKQNINPEEIKDMKDTNINEEKNITEEKNISDKESENGGNEMQ